MGGTSRGGASGRDQDECKWGSMSSPLVVLPLQVCDVVDRVLKSPYADLLREMNPVGVSY